MCATVPTGFCEIVVCGPRLFYRGPRACSPKRKIWKFSVKRINVVHFEGRIYRLDHE